MVTTLKQYAKYMWQEQKRVPVYRFQTNDHKIARKLKKRPNAKLCVFGINAPVWVFILRYSSPAKALLGLSNITGEEVEKLPEYDVFVSYTHPYMDSMDIPQVSPDATDSMNLAYSNWLEQNGNRDDTKSNRKEFLLIRDGRLPDGK